MERPHRSGLVSVGAGFSRYHATLRAMPRTTETEGAERIARIVPMSGQWRGVAPAEVPFAIDFRSLRPFLKLGAEQAFIGHSVIP
ncbi:hypothetical protein AX289_12250 [Methylorubrum populi]|nr:hypothetical protein AX289_12250 [Methylorubrum populi]